MNFIAARSSAVPTCNFGPVDVLFICKQSTRWMHKA